MSGDLTGLSKYAINKGNSERLTSYLCKMRGAALKLGQVLSTLEDSMVPPVVKEALERARAQADIMPQKQLEACLAANYGPDWSRRFTHFELEPVAAAYMCDVHRAQLPS